MLRALTGLATRGTTRQRGKSSRDSDSCPEVVQVQDSRSPPALAVFRTDGVKADLPAGKRLPFLYSTSDIPPAPPMGFTPTVPAEETPRASYELDPALIQLVGVLCLIGGCLGLVVYAILSIDE